MSLGTALAQKLKASLCEIDNLTFVVLLRFWFRFNWSVCNGADVFNDIVGLPNETNQSLVLRFEELQERPNGDVLEGGITRLQKPTQVTMDSFIRLIPVLYEDGVIPNYVRLLVKDVNKTMTSIAYLLKTGYPVRQHYYLEPQCFGSESGE